MLTRGQREVPQSTNSMFSDLNLTPVQMLLWICPSLF